jgi:hypothetical protein
MPLSDFLPYPHRNRRANLAELRRFNVRIDTTDTVQERLGLTTVRQGQLTETVRFRLEKSRRDEAEEIVKLCNLLGYSLTTSDLARLALTKFMEEFREQIPSLLEELDKGAP